MEVNRKGLGISPKTVNKHMKRCSHQYRNANPTSHLFRRATTKKKKKRERENNKAWVRKWRNWNLYRLLVEMQYGATTVDNSMVILKQFQVEVLCDLAILLLGINPKRLKAGLGGLFAHPRSQQPEGFRSNSSVHRRANREAGCGAREQGNTMQP